MDEVLGAQMSAVCMALPPLRGTIEHHGSLADFIWFRTGGPAERLGYTYRHSDLPAGAIVVEALFEGTRGDPKVIGAEMDRIAAEREASQPLRSRTGGSTFKNPEGHKAWALIDAAGCRGLRR